MRNSINKVCYIRVEQHKHYILVLLYYLSGMCLSINSLITFNDFSLVNIARLSITFVYLTAEKETIKITLRLLPFLISLTIV